MLLSYSYQIITYLFPLMDGHANMLVWSENDFPVTSCMEQQTLRVRFGDIYSKGYAGTDMVGVVVVGSVKYNLDMAVVGQRYNMN